MEDFFLSENLWSLIREELYINSLNNLSAVFQKWKWREIVYCRIKGLPSVPVYIALVFPKNVSRTLYEPELHRWGMLYARQALHRDSKVGVLFWPSVFKL